MKNILKVLMLVCALFTLPFIVTSQNTQDSENFALVFNDEEPITVNYDSIAVLDKEFEVKKEKAQKNSFTFYETHLIYVDRKGKERPYKVVGFDMIFTGTGFMYRVSTLYKNKKYIFGIEASSFAHIVMYEYDDKKKEVKSAKVFY